MHNTVYLIDYENVSYKGLYGISQVNPDDEIIVFYSNDISIIQDILSVYEKTEIKIKYFQLDKSGKNALDFMLAAYAGYAASKENVSRIALLSNDKGYLSIIPVINSISPDIELLFDNCIHNIIFPDDKKDINLINATPKPAEPAAAAPVQPDFDGAEEITLEKVKSDMEQKIPPKYVTSVSSIIMKHYSKGSSENEVAAALNKQIGGRRENAAHKNFAKEYYRTIINRY